MEAVEFCFLLVSCGQSATKWSVTQSLYIVMFLRLESFRSFLVVFCVISFFISFHLKTKIMEDKPGEIF